MKPFTWKGKLKLDFSDKDLNTMSKKYPDLDFNKRYPSKIKVTHKKKMNLIFISEKV